MPVCLLALETSTDRCGVALLRETAQGLVLDVREHDGAAEHSARILPLIGELLDEAGLSPGAISAVAFGQGPGGFTGLRVACGVAQGLAFALDVPVLPVVSHAALESRLPAEGPAVRLVAIDARMQEAYVAVYRRREGGAQEQLQAPVLMAVRDIWPWARQQWPVWSGGVAGSPAAGGLLVAGDVITATTRPADLPDACLWPEPLRPDAASVARLGYEAWRAGKGMAPELAQPLYVRDKVAFTTREREQGAGGNPRAKELA